MGSLSIVEDQITLFQNSGTLLGKQMLGCVESSERDIRSVDISKANVLGTQRTELADGINLPISELVGEEHPGFKEAYDPEEVGLDEHDWLRLLEKTPSVLVYSVAM